MIKSRQIDHTVFDKDTEPNTLSISTLHGQNEKEACFSQRVNRLQRAG
jgi:hypothetical protein